MGRSDQCSGAKVSGDLLIASGRKVSQSAIHPRDSNQGGPSLSRLIQRNWPPDADLYSRREGDSMGKARGPGGRKARAGSDVVLHGVGVRPTHVWESSNFLKSMRALAWASFTTPLNHLADSPIDLRNSPSPPAKFFIAYGDRGIGARARHFAGALDSRKDGALGFSAPTAGLGIMECKSKHSWCLSSMENAT